MRTFLLGLVVCLIVAACAQEPKPFKVFLRHQPFEGAVAGHGKDLKIELKPFAERFLASVERKGGGWTLNGQPVTTETGPGGQVLVPLSEAVALVKGKLDVDERLGAVDVLAAEDPEPVAAQYVLVNFGAPT